MALEQQTLKRQDGIVIKDPTRVMEERLGQLSAAMPLSFMARLPAAQRYDPDQIAGVPLEKFLSRFRDRGYELQSKWRAGTLLLTDDTLYQQDLNPLILRPGSSQSACEVCAHTLTDCLSGQIW